MPVREIVTPWDRQPQEWADVDWGNPISGGLSLLTMPGSRFQNIIGSVGFGGDRPSVVVGNGGIGAIAPSGTTYPTVTLPASLGQAYTVFAFGNITTVGTQGSPIDDDDGSTRGFLFRINATGGPDFIPFTSGNVPVVVSGADFSAAQLAAGVSIAGTVDATGNVAVWGNGVKTTGSLGGAPRAPSATLALLNRKAGGTQIPTTRPVYLCAAWNRVLSDAEIASLSANPWQLFQRREYIPFGSTPSGTTYNQSISGSMAAYGAILRSINKGAFGNLNLSGVSRKDTSVKRIGSLTLLANPTKLTTTSKKTGSITTASNLVGADSGVEFSQAASGSITLTSVLTDAVTFVRSWSSQITLSGAIAKPVSKLLSGVITLTGAVSKLITKAKFTATLTLSGIATGFGFTPGPGGGALSRGIRFMRKFIGRR